MSKTRMGKRVASLLLSLVMMLSLLPTTVYATGDTGETKNEIVGQATTSGDNTEGTGEPEPTGEGEDGGTGNVSESEDDAATNDAVVEETIAPVNAEGVDAVDSQEESSGDEQPDGADNVTSSAVAKIGETEYETLAAAIAAAEPGATVTLLADVNLDSAQTINKQLIIDLNGKTIDSTASQTIRLETGADLTVKDGAGGGKIANNYSGSAYPRTVYLNGAGAALTLESGTIESNPNLTSLQSVAISSENKKACTVNIKGGSVVVPEAATKGRSIVASTNSMTLNISGGTIAGGLHGVDAYSGSNVTITDGEITARYVDTGVIKEAYGMRLKGTANVTVAGGTITGVKMDDSGYKGDVPAVKLKSGTIKGSFYSVSEGTIIFTVAENADIVLENNSAAQFLPDEVKLVQNANGTYGIKAGTYVADVAEVGGKKYETLQEAINATKTGDTVTLLADVDLGSSGVSFYNKKDTSVCNLTFDLNGHTITSAIGDKGTVLAAREGLVIKNGTIENTCTDTKAKDATSAVYVTSGGTTTLENVTLHSNYSGLYVCQLSNAVTVVVNVEEDTVISGGKYGVDLDAPKGAATTAPGVTLNVNGGTITGTTDGIYANSPGSGKYGTINANITAGTVGGVRVVSNNTKQPVKLDITGGTINGELYNLGSTVTISGGTFAIKPDTTYLAKGYTITENADNTYGVKKTTYVAEVNGTQYESLQAAINAASRNGTVKLLADTRENVTISTPYLTLDLNGFTLNGSTGERRPALTITARVTVMDSSEAKTGTIMREDTAENSGVSSHYVIDIQGAGWLTFESGNVKNDSGAGGTKGASLVRVGSDSVAKYPGLNIKGGTFTQDNFIVIKVERGDLFLNGGSLNSANSYAVQTWHRATISGGTVNGAVSSWTYSTGSNSTLEISGGTVNGNVESVSYDGAEGKLAKVKITGGTVNGTLSTKCYNNATAPSKDIATIEVTGGTFSSDPTKYLVECSTVNTNADGTFGVEKAYLAKVGDTPYYTMDEAFKAQTASGEAIVLLRDYTTGSTFNSGTVARVVDLGGYTWTCTGTDANSAAFEINNPDASLTVKNGKIVSSQLVGLIPSAMGGTITYNNSGLLFDGVVMTTTATSGIETNGNNTNDTVTLKDSTLNVPNGFGIYFPSSGTLTIDNSTINAKTMGVQVCAGSLSINAGSTITVTGDAVHKTENDGAIQDGAAISIVNRIGYKSLGDVTVTGGTFKANGTNEAIKAYDWKDNTESAFTANDKINVSGGTFSSIPSNMAALCKVGYRAVEDKDNNVYIVKEGKYVIEVTSRIQDTNQTVATPTGGGQADYGEEVTVTTYAVTGFTFLGWYDSEGKQLSTKDDMTYTHKVTGDCTLIAKYAQDSTRMFRLTVNGTVFTVNERTEYAHHYSELASGSRVAIVYTGTDNFLYWVNASKNVVTTNKTLEYTMVNDAEFTAVTAPATSDSAIVVFKNNIERGQELQARRYYSNETIVFPATPSSYGKTFAYWAILDTNGNILKDQAGNAVVATESAIKAKIAEGTGYIVVAAVYTANGYYKATAHFVDSNGNTVANDMVNANVPTGSGWQVTAPDVKNKFFSHWKDADDNVLSTNQTYAIYAMDTVEVTAVYVDTENDKHATMNTVKLTALTRVVGNSHDLGLVAQYDVASGKTINRVGILFTTNANYKDSLTLENKKALTSTPLDNPENNSNVYRHWLNGINNLSTVVYARAYVTTTDGETIYSEVIEGSFNSWNGN